ncbi:hypothetical protein Bbelb_108860 [Branchiostoma belcheri]|nr:hypothetical protein Bbelb_108860 [Branchiostoma belcheri]
MFQGFYDEVATPLLFDVQMRYPENLVTDLTPVDFNTYFDGSELVVAGRLSNEVSRTLDVSVVGNTVDSQLTLEKEVNVTAPHKALLKYATSLLHVQHFFNIEKYKAVGDFTQRLWAYLTIKHYLKQRLIAEPGEKTNLTAKALALSLKYNFVTPLTSMIGSAFSGPGPVGVPGSAFPVSPGGAFPVSPGGAFPVSPVGVPGSAFPAVPAGGVVSGPVPGRPAFARPPPVRFAKGRGGGGQSVDGDPHFIVDMPGLNATLCFDINGQAGDVLNLLRDRALGTVVNARVVAAKRVPEGKQKLPTYFGELSIAVGSIRIFITPKEILLLGRDPAHAQDLVIPWGKRSKLLRGPVNIDVRRRRMSVRHVGSGVEFVVLQHPVREDHPIKPDYLGFYVQNGKGLSTGVHGLIGQFHYGTANLHIDDDPLEGGVRKARIYIKDRKVEVHEKERRNHLINKRVRCWLAPNNADQLIDGHWRDYLVPDMFSLKDSQMAGNAVLEVVCQGLKNGGKRRLVGKFSVQDSKMAGNAILDVPTHLHLSEVRKVVKSGFPKGTFRAGFEPGTLGPGPNTPPLHHTTPPMQRNDSPPYPQALLWATNNHSKNIGRRRENELFMLLGEVLIAKAVMSHTPSSLRDRHRGYTGYTDTGLIRLDQRAFGLNDAAATVLDRTELATEASIACDVGIYEQLISAGNHKEDTADFAQSSPYPRPYPDFILHQSQHRKLPVFLFSLPGVPYSGSTHQGSSCWNDGYSTSSSEGVENGQLQTAARQSVRVCNAPRTAETRQATAKGHPEADCNLSSTFCTGVAAIDAFRNVYADMVCSCPRTSANCSQFPLLTPLCRLQDGSV